MPKFNARPTATAGLLLLGVIFAAPPAWSIDDPFGIGPEVTEIEEAIDEARARLDLVARGESLRDARLNLPLRSVRKALSQMARKVDRSAGIHGALPDVAQLNKYIAVIEGAVDGFERAIAARELRAAFHQLDALAAIVEAMAHELLASSARPSPEPVPLAPAPPETTPMAPAVDLIISRVEVTRYLRLFGESTIEVTPHVTNTGPERTGGPIEIRITYFRRHRCAIDGGLGGGEEKAPNGPCASFRESSSLPAATIAFTVDVDPDQRIPETDENNNRCRVFIIPGIVTETDHDCPDD